MNVSFPTRSIVLAGAALILLKQAHAGNFGTQANKVVLVSSLAMGLLLRQLFAGTNKKLITNPTKVAGKDAKEYDFIIVGGGV